MTWNVNDKLLINGCSFTWGQGLEDRTKTSWPSLIKNSGKVKGTLDLSSPGKDNFHILNEVYHYLLLSELEDSPVTKVTHVIIQTTDFFRSLIYKKNFSGYIKYDRYTTQLRNRHFFTKLNNWNFDAVHELGAFLSVPVNSPVEQEFVNVIIPVGDLSQSYNKMLSIILLKSIDSLCKKLNIKLCVIPYYGLNEWADEKLFQSIDKDIFLVDSMDKVDGLYQELLDLGFKQTDNFHFDEQAHKWHVDAISNFFHNGTKVILSKTTKSKDSNIPHFDYTDERD